MKRLSAGLSVLFLLVAVALLANQARDWRGVLFFVPFSLGPLLLNLVPALLLRSRLSQWILSLAAVAYFSWFCWIYCRAFYVNPDPQSPIALVVIGIYALPVMILLWIAAAIANWFATRAHKNHEFNSVGEATGDPKNPYLPPHSS